MNSKPELWALHIEGPDDIFAMPSKEAAEAHAVILNERLPDHCRAVAKPWPHSAEAHAEDMRSNLKEEAFSAAFGDNDA